MFCAPFAVDSGWGSVKVEQKGAARLTLHGGSLQLRSIRLPFAPKEVYADGKTVAFAAENGVITLADGIKVEKELSIG